MTLPAILRGGPAEGTGMQAYIDRRIEENRVFAERCDRQRRRLNRLVARG